MPLRPTTSKETLKLSLELRGPRTPAAFQKFRKELGALLRKHKAVVTARAKRSRVRRTRAKRRKR